jgi:hypothetical protein
MGGLAEGEVILPKAEVEVESPLIVHIFSGVLDQFGVPTILCCNEWLFIFIQTNNIIVIHFHF